VERIEQGRTHDIAVNDTQVSINFMDAPKGGNKEPALGSYYARRHFECNRFL
jgi:hypothetical protein